MTEPKSAYVLVKDYSGQVEHTLFFVYPERDHIRFLLRDMYVDNPNPDLVESMTEAHDNGETADLWLVERGRVTARIDLLPFLELDRDGRMVIDRDGFDAAVPATIDGEPIRRGDALPPLDGIEGLRYGMWVDVGGELDDQPEYEFTAPDA